MTPVSLVIECQTETSKSILPFHFAGESQLKKFCLVLALLTCIGSAAHGQARSTASRAGDLQIGGSYSSANSDYLPQRIRGFGFYSDFDFRANLGVEVDFHQLSDPQTNSMVYERSYEVGARYFRTYNRFKPYARVSFGRGVFNFPNSVANLAYNMAVFAGGVDVEVYKRINVRAEYEYQRWLSFPPDGLNPTMFTFGVAYHFPAGSPR
jgi:opacity protein-like surface antigen